MIDWNFAINVTVTGILLVFLMLLLLVFILYIFGFVSVSLSKAKDIKAKKAREAAFAEMTAESAPVVDVPQVNTQNKDDDDDEIIAVISAAVYSLYQNSSVKPVIKSIKKASSRRSSWAKAGIADNTRTF